MDECAVVVRRIEDRLPLAAGGWLFRRAWIPERPQRVLVLVHGFGEHSGRYEELASWLAARSVAVHAYDQRGHGRTPGRRGHVDRFERLYDDLCAMLEFVAREHPGLPIALLGHSLGGLVVTGCVRERRPPIDRLVVSGPAFRLAPGVSKTRIALARLLRRLCPRLSLAAGLDAALLSRDPEVVRRYVEDPWVHGRATAAFAAGAIDAQLRLVEGPAAIPVPMLLLHGEDDGLCSVEGSRAFFARIEHERAPGGELRTYPGLRHEVLNEPEREQVYRDVLAWLAVEPALRRSPAAGAGA